MYKKLLLALCLCVGAQAMAGPLFQDKVYATGKPVADKPMVLRDFVEFRNARALKPMSFRTLDGKAVTLKQYAGTMVILDVWATWCEPCLRSLKPLMAKQQKYNRPGSKLSIVSVSIDEGKTDVRKFLARMGVPAFHTLRDAEQKQITKNFPLDVVPAAFVVDGKGNLVGFLRGYVDWEDESVEPYLEALAAKYARPAPAK
ncbi:MAG: TlpA family protein disulfide reductase [Duodenibacillus sp.]|nr:TlpA family protein disulfide reductase [Duodenibacillus sp.]